MNEKNEKSSCTIKWEIPKLERLSDKASASAATSCQMGSGVQTCNANDPPCQYCFSHPGQS